MKMTHIPENKMKRMNTNKDIPSRAQSIIDDLQPRAFGRLGKLWIAGLSLFVLIGLFFYVQQVRQGLGITGMRDYSTWGIYVSNFVFFVAISLVGSLISAILKLSKATWADPLTRIAEMIAVAAIIFAAIVIIIDMGRPDRFYNVIIHARIQSPITWDVIVITTYLFISLLLLYLPLIPDLAILKKRSAHFSKWQNKLYAILSLNWKNLPEQVNILNKSITTLAIIIVPVAFGIHTVTSWLFATTYRPGWDSTNFGPYFVSGAFMVGAAAVIVAMFFFRKSYKLEAYIQLRHFDYMGRLLVLLSLVYLYFNINEYFVPAYKMKSSEVAHLKELFIGRQAPLFWTVQLLGMIVPIVVLIFKKGRKPLPLVIVSIMVVIGAWFKRFLIVVPSLAHPLIPTNRVDPSWLHYFPTVPEWFITIGTLCGALLIITLLARYIPIIPISETIALSKQGQNERAKR